MSFLGLSSVLVLSPHPDDAEYSLSGTVLKSPDTKFYILPLSNGGDYDLCSEERYQEVIAFWRDVPNVTIVDRAMYGFIKTWTEDTIIRWVEEMCVEHNVDFDCILTPPENDCHFEHAITYRVGRALTRKTKISLIEYNTPSADHTWNPNLYVDITDVYQEKKQRLKVFDTQKTRKYFDSNSVDSFHTNYFCNKRQYGHTEMFRVNFMFL